MESRGCIGKGNVTRYVVRAGARVGDRKIGREKYIDRDRQIGDGEEGQLLAHLTSGVAFLALALKTTPYVPSPMAPATSNMSSTSGIAASFRWLKCRDTMPATVAATAATGVVGAARMRHLPGGVFDTG